MRLIKTVIGISVLAIIFLAVAGVIHVQNNENDASIKLDKKELKEKTHEAIEKTKKAGSEGLDRMGKTLQNAANDIENPLDAQSPPDTSTPVKSEENNQSDQNQHLDKADSSPKKNLSP